MQLKVHKHYCHKSSSRLSFIPPPQEAERRIQIFESTLIQAAWPRLVAGVFASLHTSFPAGGSSFIVALKPIVHIRSIYCVTHTHILTACG